MVSSKTAGRRGAGEASAFQRRKHCLLMGHHLGEPRPERALGSLVKEHLQVGLKGGPKVHTC